MKYCCNEDDVFYHIVMTKTKTKTMTNTNTKCTQHPTYAIFLKSRQFKDIKYDQTRTDFNLADLVLELAFLFDAFLIPSPMLISTQHIYR